ncbi:activating signal cointegrator 1 complex subunit 2-like [Diadema antillarum]|uniref:activating signal cointegrator 1 complex subunit 2-like n=1 Tax=Diadema antillarum TaxID=105358 RepID=UPI003A84F847
MEENKPLPLEQRMITVSRRDGSKMSRPALSEYWVEQVNFVKYTPPPDQSDEVGLEEWAERLRFMEEDLQWLLKLPHHRFWSQVVYDVTLRQSLASYLQNAPRSHDPSKAIPPDPAGKHRLVHRLIFMTFLRMSTYKETKDNFITPKCFGSLIYDNFLFDIAKMMDLCVLYGGGNGALLTKMLDNVFTQQPQYQNDLTSVVNTTLTLFDKVQEKCGSTGRGHDSAQLLAPGSRQPISNHDLYDMVMYVADIAQTLLAFFQVYPAACRVFYHDGIVGKIASFYETTLQELLTWTRERKWEVETVKATLERHLLMARAGLVHTCVLIISTCCVQPILNNSGSLEVSHHVETYLELLSSLLTEKIFLAALCDHSSLRDDIDMVLQTSHQIDDTRIKFILSGVNEAMELYGRKKAKPLVVPGPGPKPADRASSSSQSLDVVVPAPTDYQTDVYLEDQVASASASAPVKTGVELDSLISGVKDLLPDLGEGFIEACLEEYNYDSARVINDILEDKLLESLRSLDRTMARTKPKAAPPEDLISQRANIFDNDEFDVFSRDKVDVTRIHKGKKKEEKEKAILDDKSLINQLKKSYEQYYEVSYEYEDEYDDTYDTVNVGADDADSADELTTRRPFTMPRVLAASQQKFSSEDEAVDNEDEEDDDGATKRGGGGGGGGSGPGRTEQETRSRQRNERHKGQRANHNRRVLADKKRAKGMGPLPS